jgi:hypothetical protein
MVSICGLSIPAAVLGAIAFVRMRRYPIVG